MGVATCTDVRIFRFKRKLNLMSKHSQRRKGSPPGSQGQQVGLDAGEAVPGVGTPTLSSNL